MTSHTRLLNTVSAFQVRSDTITMQTKEGIHFLSFVDLCGNTLSPPGGNTPTRINRHWVEIISKKNNMLEISILPLLQKTKRNKSCFLNVQVQTKYSFAKKKVCPEKNNLVCLPLKWLQESLQEAYISNSELLSVPEKSFLLLIWNHSTCCSLYLQHLSILVQLLFLLGQLVFILDFLA